MSYPIAAASLLSLVAAAPSVSVEFFGQDAILQRLRTRTVIRVERIEVPRIPAYREHRADRCIEMRHIRAAAVSSATTVDFVMDNGHRLRARLEAACPQLGFYGGLYLRSTADGRVCAGREVVRARSGRACGIESFVRLVPER